jgi:hypothetical protein
MANRVPVTMLGCLVWTSRLFDYLDPEEGRIYNDVVRRIGSVSKNWKAQKTTVLKTRFGPGRSLPFDGEHVAMQDGKGMGQLVLGITSAPGIWVAGGHMGDKKKAKWECRKAVN